MLDHRAQRKRRHVGQRADEHQRAQQQDDEERSVRRQRAAVAAKRFLLASEPAIASTGTIVPKRPNHMAMASSTL